MSNPELQELIGRYLAQMDVEDVDNIVEIFAKVAQPQVFADFFMEMLNYKQITSSDRADALSDLLYDLDEAGFAALVRWFFKLNQPAITALINQLRAHMEKLTSKPA